MRKWLKKKKMLDESRESGKGSERRNEGRACEENGKEKRKRIRWKFMVRK